MTADPAQLFNGVLAFAVPHMDDCVLACGGTIARLPDKSRIHVIYATDGMGSPAPALPWLDSVSPDLGRVRIEEAKSALGHLGVPTENVHFAGLPDGRLHRHTDELSDALERLLREIEPDRLFVPFRYDRHTDHLALYATALRLLDEHHTKTELVEYFVYYRSRLLPGGDVRRYIRPEHLVEIDVGGVSERKRVALDRFRSQTTRYYSWQSSPTLGPELLDEVSRSPEVFLRADRSVRGPAVFDRAIPWILFVHHAEPVLKRGKDRVKALLRRGLR